jgi:hypothetical protein
VHTYLGAKLARDELVFLTADRSADVNVVIRRVSSNDADTDTRSINTISFKARAGRAHSVRSVSVRHLQFGGEVCGRTTS